MLRSNGRTVEEIALILTSDPPNAPLLGYGRPAKDLVALSGFGKDIAAIADETSWRYTVTITNSTPDQTYSNIVAYYLAQPGDPDSMGLVTLPDGLGPGETGVFPLCECSRLLSFHVEGDFVSTGGDSGSFGSLRTGAWHPTRAFVRWTSRSDASPRRDMADREVTAVRRDDRGRTIALANPEQTWSPVFAQEAVAHIEAGLHSYHTARGDDHASIEVIYGRAGPYLRTAADTSTHDNLDDLPLDTAVNPIAGDFDVMLQFSEASLAIALRGMHASGALAHKAGIMTSTHVAVIVLGPQRVQIDGAVPGSAIVRMPYHCWVRPAAHLDDPGDCATGVIEAPVACYTMVDGDGAVALATDWSAVSPANVSVDSAVAMTVADNVRTAVATWARSAGGRYTVPANAFGQPAAIGLRFADSLGGGGCVQVGINIEDSSGVSFPDPGEKDVQLALSGRWVTERILDALGAQLGSLPPPRGVGDVDVGDGILLTALDVELIDAGMLIHGSMRVGTVSASVYGYCFIGRSDAANRPCGY